MSEGLRAVFRGVRPLDGILAGALTALAGWLMVENVRVTDSEIAADLASGSMVHPMSSHSWLMLPVFLFAVVPVLWWRRNLFVVTGVAVIAMVLHDVAFGLTASGPGSGHNIANSTPSQVQCWPAAQRSDCAWRSLAVCHNASRAGSEARS